MTGRVFGLGVVTLSVVACASGYGGSGANNVSPTSAPAATPTSNGVEPLGPVIETPLGDFVRSVEAFDVFDIAGHRYELPFLGGYDVPRPQFIDIDGDADLDLFVQERTDQLVFLENIGSPEEARFSWRTDRFQDLEVGEWSRFTDLDGDGDFDLLAESIFSYVRYYRNDGGPDDPRFVAVGDSVRNPSGVPVFSDRQNIPNVADIECDGVPDLFLGRVDGTVVHHRLAGFDEVGVPRFELITERFEEIEIVAQIGGSPVGDALPTKHGANSMGIADYDGDGDPDFLWGDFFEPSVLLIENVGSCGDPNLRVEPIPVATRGDSLLTSGYNVPVPADIDADGDLDLIVGVLGGAFNPNRSSSDNLQLWSRGPDGALELATKRYLDGVDLGSETRPTLADLDADGDLDLLVGNRISPFPREGGLVFHFENRGSVEDPEFHLADTLRIGSNYNYHPVPFDWDDDGDLDLVTGTYNDDVILVRNDGTATAPEFTVTDSVLIELTRGSHTVLEFGDVDGDGDPDLFVGESSGTLNFYRNTGAPGAPEFELVSDEYLDLDVGQRSHPVLVDWDLDGDLDLLVAREDQGLLLFTNNGSGEWTAAGEVLHDLPPFAAPVFRDMDADGDLDLLSGGLSGGLVYYENVG